VDKATICMSFTHRLCQVSFAFFIQVMCTYDSVKGSECEPYIFAYE
jgi:hypothetical protein